MDVTIEGDGTPVYEVSIIQQGPKGDTGNGIASMFANPDGTILITYTNGSTYTTPSFKGDKGDAGSANTPTKTITGNITLDNTFNNAIVLLKANATITIPSGLAVGFNMVVKSFTGAVGTYTAGTGATVSSESDGLTQYAKSTISVIQDGANNYILIGTK